jgi:hypothetical protein
MPSFNQDIRHRFRKAAKQIIGRDLTEEELASFLAHTTPAEGIPQEQIDELAEWLVDQT